jgi:RNA 3'-phosphate cyclase
MRWVALMIEIDGSYGEGGGALLRVSTALSALTGNPIHIQNIRAGRPQPGLMPQHLNAILALQNLSKAVVKGLTIGSEEISFIPNALQEGDYQVKVGTAGSINLILQAFIIPAGFAPGPVEISLKGGTDVRWAPPVDYLRNVTLPVLSSIGHHIDLKLLKRGYYPRGGGRLQADMIPLNNFKPFHIHDLQVDFIRGVSHCTKLPRHVAIRQAQAAEKRVKLAGYDTQIEIDTAGDALGPGSGIVLWSEFKGKSSHSLGRVGGSSLGEPGKRAELVGHDAAVELLRHLSIGAPLDRYMADQIIPYMAIHGSSSVEIAELTSHTLTNIYAAEKITGHQFQVNGCLGGSATISMD